MGFEFFKQHVLYLDDNVLRQQLKDPVLVQAAEVIKQDPDITIRRLAQTIGVNWSTLNSKIRKYVRELERGRRAIVVEHRIQGHHEAQSGEGDRGRQPQAAGAGVAEVVRRLGREYAEIVTHVTEKVDWFMDAVVNIGFHTIIAAFQFARIDPKEFMRRVEDFKDSDEFVRHVLRYLDAMIQQGAEGAQRLVEAESELEKLRAYVELLESMYLTAIEQRDRAITYLRASVASMCEEDLRRFILAYAMSEFIGAQARPSQEERPRQEVA